MNHGNKRQQTVTEKGSCKHCGKFGYEKTIASSLSGIERIGAPTEKAKADDVHHGEEELVAEVERQASKRSACSSKQRNKTECSSRCNGPSSPREGATHPQSGLAHETRTSNVGASSTDAEPAHEASPDIAANSRLSNDKVHARPTTRGARMDHPLSSIRPA
ncbi:hypothetical protein Cgig2_010859 [Carnegiea gigantea]|uniref:Uncharacterized protein n=1 Tax=Carnegiea gigantea TaxID=171969 RepID=A0A9Q1GMU7_9CARY|nr:hypothetical protein Cgig2_010859 [Carnegiea gigantea]